MSDIEDTAPESPPDPDPVSLDPDPGEIPLETITAGDEPDPGMLTLEEEFQGGHIIRDDDD